MNYIVNNYPRLTFILLGSINLWLLIAIAGCNLLSDNEIIPHKTSDLSELLKSDKLKVGVQYKAAEIYLKDGKHTGYIYDLINDYANHLEIDFELIPLKNEREKLEKLKTGAVDLVAGLSQQHLQQFESLPINISKLFLSSQLVLVQRKKSKNKALKVVDSFEELKTHHIYASNNLENNFFIKSLSEKHNLNIWFLDDKTDQFQMVKDVVLRKIGLCNSRKQYCKTICCCKSKFRY